MATHIGIGFSSLADPAQAAKEAAAQAKKQLNTRITQLVVVFTSMSHASPVILDAIFAILQPQKIIGSSSAGLIMPDKIASQGISILAISSDEIHMNVATLGEIKDKDMRFLGFQMARDISTNKNPGRQILTVFADSGLISGALFSHGAKEVLGSTTPIVDGISSDQFQYKKSVQYYQSQMLTNSMVGLLISGQITISVGSRHGWKPLGKPRTIDKAHGSVIHTIDGERAVKLYETYFDEDFKTLKDSRLGAMAVLYPIGIYLENERTYLLRNAIDILDDGSIVCQGEVPEGAEMHLMIGSKDSCKQAALDAALEVRDGLSGHQAKLILIIESMTRYKMLGRSAVQEIQVIKDILGYTTPMIGMYSAGEIAPLQSIDHTRNTQLQNESIVIIAIS